MELSYSFIIAIQFVSYRLNPDIPCVVLMNCVYNQRNRRFAGRVTHRRLGNWDQVERHLNKAIELDPRNPNLYQELSYFYFISREYNKADTILDRHIDLAPDALVYPWVMKAWIHLELNGTLDGYKVWMEKLRPENPADIAPYYWGQYLYLSRN